MLVKGKVKKKKLINWHFHTVALELKFSSIFCYLLCPACRSSSPEVFSQKGVLKHFTKIHRKTPVPESLFLIKLQAWVYFAPSIQLTLLIAYLSEWVLFLTMENKNLLHSYLENFTAFFFPHFQVKCLCRYLLIKLICLGCSWRYQKSGTLAKPKYFLQMSNVLKRKVFK